MKTKIILTIFTTITLLAQMPILTLSQTNDFAPNSFSTFSAPQNLGATVNWEGTDNAPFVAPNGLSLYMSGNRAGGPGGGDIWVSQRPTLTSAWGAPQNLGSVVNTESLENAPTLSSDGKALFFHSTRPGGTGGRDIYLATRTNPNDDFGWTAPVNLTVVNSTANESAPGYFEDPSTGSATIYFSSDRTGGLGADDIYQSTRNANGTFNTPTLITPLNSTALDARPQVRLDGLKCL